MTHRTTTAQTQPPTLTQQKADFTAEGAPPPGQGAAGAARPEPDREPHAAPADPAAPRKRPPAARRR
jgi:hypothetical protein